MTQISVRGGGAAGISARGGGAPARFGRRLASLALAVAMVLFGALAMPGLPGGLGVGAAQAQEGPLPDNLPTVGAPQEWQLGFQPSATPVMDAVYDFHDLLLVVIFAISIFVLLLLLYVIVRFRAARNPNPSRTSHNTMVEVIWTIVPVLILVVIAIPSFRLLYMEDQAIDPDLTIKATGHQWYWSYEYPDEGIAFDSLMVADADLKPGQPRLLATDTAVVVPVNKKVRLLTTASDVLHSWAIPSFGVKIDSVPGRINESWFQAQREGIYYGQCSELCGVNHAFMPITVIAVSQEDYDRWLAWAKEEYAAVTLQERSVASAAQAAAVPADVAR